MPRLIVDITLKVILLSPTPHQRHPTQLIAHIPRHGLPTLQFQLITRRIKPQRYLRLSRQGSIVKLRQTPIAARRSEHRNPGAPL